MATITEDYVSFEIAKLLKEKGFGIEEETRGYYPIKGDAAGRLMFGAEYHHNTSQVQIAAPTHQMVMKWLREVYGIFIQIELYSKYDNYNFEIFQNTHRLWIQESTVYSTYTETVEMAVKYCLEHLI